MKLNLFCRILAVLVLPVMLAACATPTNLDYREGYDFSSIHSVQIDPSAQPASSDTRVNSPLVDARIRKAIMEQLATKGVSVVDGKADASLVYQVATRAGIQTDNSGISIGVGTFSHHSAVGVGYGFPGYDTSSYDDMVLTIDILDIHDSAMLWRGSSSVRLADGSTPETITSMVNKLVSDILANYPPGKK